MSEQYDLLKSILLEKSVRTGTFTLASGKVSDLYVDCRIEGNFQAGDTVVVVDDVITTGGSTLKAIDAIEAEGGRVAAALVLLDREEGGRQAIEERGIPVYPLYTRTSLLGR